MLRRFASLIIPRFIAARPGETLGIIRIILEAIAHAVTTFVVVGPEIAIVVYLFITL
jgi:hypothetical protein